MQRRYGGGRKDWPKILKKLKPGDSDLEAFIARVRERYPHTLILLFGSRARGDHLPYSDYDVAIVFEKLDNRLKLAEEIARLKPPQLPLDLVLLSLDDLNDPTTRRMLTPCKTLYRGLNVEDPCKTR